MPKTIMACLTFCIIASLSLPTAQAKKKSQVDHRPRLLKAMAAEMDRSMKNLKMNGFETPYFIAYEMKDIENHRIEARYGAIYSSGGGKNRRLRVEVRVGNYEFDNIGKKNRSFDFSFSPGYTIKRTGPMDPDPEALQNSLWQLTDATYKGALKAYLKLKSQKVTEVDDGEWAGSFSKEKSTKNVQASQELDFDKEQWEKLARSTTAIFEKHPEIFDSHMTIDGSREVRYLVTSEGTRLISERILYNLSVFAVTRADDGMLLTNQMTLYARGPKDLPSYQDLMKQVKQLIADLKALRQAPVLEPYTGPAILDGDATGVLFHEVIGHRLEGERQLDDHEGKTFKGQVGKKIIPAFLSIIDDPTLVEMEGIKLNGTYVYDDEGVKAQRVMLVEKGVLKNFLTSRTPIKGFLKSNGHGRSSPGSRPRARMGNTIVLSDRMISMTELKKRLLEEVKKQDKPFGLLIKNIVGGSTHTSTWGYQAYKGIPQLVYRIFPDGREELVRGVEIVGTPLSSINKIVATSDRISVFNGFCGAESGYVPVSAAAPDVLMTEVELQRSMKISEKSQVLPSPWTGAAKK